MKLFLPRRGVTVRYWRRTRWCSDERNSNSGHGHDHDDKGRRTLVLPLIILISLGDRVQNVPKPSTIPAYVEDGNRHDHSHLVGGVVGIFYPSGFSTVVYVCL